jgi:hypothetical protein
MRPSGADSAATRASSARRTAARHGGSVASYTSRACCPGDASTATRIGARDGEREVDGEREAGASVKDALPDAPAARPRVPGVPSVCPLWAERVSVIVRDGEEERVASMLSCAQCARADRPVKACGGAGVSDLLWRRRCPPLYTTDVYIVFARLPTSAHSSGAGFPTQAPGTYWRYKYSSLKRSRRSRTAATVEAPASATVSLRCAWTASPRCI